MKIYKRATDEEIKKALTENDYQISETARALGYTRVAYLKARIENNPTLKKMVNGVTQRKREQIRYSEEDFIEAIYEARGKKNVIAQILGLESASVYKRFKDHPELEEHLKIASDEMKDIAELKLYELVEHGNLDAIKFYLSRQGRDRGYGDKLELDAGIKAEVAPTWDLSKLSVEELKALEQLSRKALPEE